MRRHVAVLLLGLGALLVTPGAAGEPDVPGDPTPPVVTPVIAGTVGDAGWYTSNVTVNWSIVDPESIILSTTGCNAVTFTTNTTGTQLTCTAESDGGTTTVSKTFKVDKTAPSTSATPSRAPDANGWYNHDLTVAFNGTDTTSGLHSCSAPKVYGGPDSTSTSVSGTCRDIAGNVAPAVLPLLYDETSPQASPGARPPDKNGWYNHAVTVTFQGADATSGIQSCTQVTYDGPDDPSVALSGTCVDRAGNQSSASVFTLKYDETAPSNGGGNPSRGADANGWYNQAFTITFQGSDATSGIETCTQVNYGGPDNTNASVSGFCRDLAGNQSGTTSFPFKYDATAPALVPDAVPDANANGWHKAALTVKFPGSDATSGIATCTPDHPYNGPDTTGTQVTGSCTDKAGNTTGPKTYTLKYDATAPALVPDPVPDANAQGWHRAPLTVRFPGSDATSGIGSCTPDHPYSGPDTTGTQVTGSCTDQAGNSSGAKTYTLKYDATAPALVPDPVPDPNAQGWHRAPLTVKFPGSDATSGIGTCTPDHPYSGPDTTNTAITGSCTDQAGNSSGLKTYTLKYDATAPALTPTPSRAPDANGWYNHTLSVSFPGTDGTSGIGACTPQQNYSGPDNAEASISGSCTDNAGNTTPKILGFKYDGTAPVLVPDPVPDPNAQGWHRAPLTVKFPGSDATSGIGTCTPDHPYSGPDTTNTAITGSCTDQAGNSSGAKTYTLKYDATAPALVPDPMPDPNAQGWHRAPLTVKFPGSDATSGIGSCTPDHPYSGPDTTGTQVTGSCTDQAGNSSGLKTYTLKYDATVPQVTGVTPAPDPTGWYTQPVVFGFQGNDPTPGSGLDACPSVTYDGPDGADAAVTGACLDKAGNVGTRLFPLKYDDTGPAVIPSAARGPDSNGWYNHQVSVSFAGSDGASGLASCAPPQSYDGPDSVFAVVSGTCTDNAGNVGLGSLALKYDSTAPQVVGASPDRAPDGNGWYNHALTVSFLGSDATSQIDGCTAAGYAGPDNPSASLSGSCRDRAGNQSGASAFGFRYDGSAPSLVSLTVKAGNRSAVLTWVASPDTSLVEIVRTAGTRGLGVTVYRGTGRSFTDSRLENGVRYRYTLNGYDEARNMATREAAATPTAPLFSPRAGATVSAPPRLVWKAVEKATYYNVQVWRRGKIFSAWPTGTSLQLKRTWKYAGRSYRLSPGRYNWYVWPGYRSRARKDFGPLLGSSSFVVKAPRR